MTKVTKIFFYYLISQMLLNAAGSKHGHQELKSWVEKERKRDRANGNRD